MHYEQPSLEAIGNVVASVGENASTVVPITTGWDCFVYEINGRWMIKIPRRSEIAQSFDAEQKLLKEIASRVSYRVPVPEWQGEIAGLPAVLYRRVGGRPMRRGDKPEAVSNAISELHSVPAAELSTNLAMPQTIWSWVDQYRQLWVTIEHDVLKVLDSALAQLVEKRFVSFVTDTDWSAVKPMFVHRDLGAEHVLMSEDGWAVEGMIDFGDATIGDPAIDFVGVLLALGKRGALHAICQYGGLDLDRLFFYYWLAPVHEILYGQRTGDSGAIRRGAEELDHRARNNPLKVT
jgi:aminoglycoside phosphotransferase (APT) family kinase protein